MYQVKNRRVVQVALIGDDSVIPEEQQRRKSRSQEREREREECKIDFSF